MGARWRTSSEGRQGIAKERPFGPRLVRRLDKSKISLRPVVFEPGGSGWSNNSLTKRGLPGELFSRSGQNVNPFRRSLGRPILIGRVAGLKLTLFAHLLFSAP